MYKMILSLLPNKEYSLYENICRIAGIIILFICVSYFLYSSYISSKFKYRNIEHANIVIESTEKFSQEQINELIEIAKIDFIKWDLRREGFGLEGNGNVYVLNRLTFIEENNDIKTKDGMVFLAEYDWYKEPLYYLFNKSVSYKEYWYFVRNDNETSEFFNEFFLKTKSSTFSPNYI